MQGIGTNRIRRIIFHIALPLLLFSVLITIDLLTKSHFAKVKKGVSDSWNIELTKNPDILKTICSERVGKAPLIIGFSAESENLLNNACAKIQAKGCDYIIANDISKKDSGFSSDYNEVYIIDKHLNTKHIERATKLDVAKKILESVFEQELSNSETGSVCTA